MERALIERLSIDDECLWIEDGGRPRGYPLGSSALRQWCNDTKDRLNSIATIPDPVAFVAAARECFRSFEEEDTCVMLAALRRLGEVMK